MWTENDYNTLLLNSYLGITRTEIKNILGRSTSKIFSKIQKHQKMLKNVQKTLEVALKGNKAKVISAENINKAEFFYLDRYFTTMKQFSDYCQE